MTAKTGLPEHPGHPSVSQRVAISMVLMLCLSRIADAQVSVTTYHNDNGRTGQNISEPYLSPGNVNKATFGKLFARPVDGYIYAQPLYLSGISIPNQGIHNVVYVATQHDSAYAFDADSNLGPNSAPLWHVSFIDPANGVTPVDINALLTCDDIIPEVGVTGTPVIDKSTNTMYVVVKTLENLAVVQRLHALDVTTGAEKFGGPVVIQGQVDGTGVGSSGGVLTFDPLRQNQRSGLLLQNGLVYIAWASHCDQGPWHGWVMAYEAQTLSQVAAWVSTPNGSAGGIWQSGAAPAADSNYVYFSTGNGTFNVNTGGTDFGDSVLKLSPPAGGTFADVDYFTPFNQATLRNFDWDLGSGGVMLLPPQLLGSLYPNLLVTGGKEGTLYLINRDGMGRFSSTADQNVQTLYGATGSIFNTPAWWNNRLYLAGNGWPLQSFSFDPTTQFFNTVASSKSSNLFTARSPSPSISANGNSNAIVWALDNAGFSLSKPAVLFAYNATNLANLLYSTRQNSSRDMLGPAVKFTVPTVANGKVYIGTATELEVLGLIPNLSPVTGGGQTAVAGSVLPEPLQVIATDPYSGKPVSGTTVTFSDGGRHGTFSNPSVVTDTTGLASTTYTLPTQAQTVTVTITAPGYTVATYKETGVPGPPFRVNVAGGNMQIGLPSMPLPLPLTARVVDQYNNGVLGISVNFADGGAGGSFSTNPVVSNSTGRAGVIYTTPPTTGTLKVKATVAGTTLPATFSETVQ